MIGVGVTTRNIAAALLCAFLAACGPIKALSSLGGGPNVAANTNIGKTNAQTIGQTNITEQKLVKPVARSIEQSTGTTKVKAEVTGAITVNEKDSPWLVITIAAMAAFATAGWLHGWLSPSPRERKLLRELQLLKDRDRNRQPDVKLPEPSSIL